MNNQVLHLANQGVTLNQIHNVYETPEGIAQQWYNRGYHGSPENNSRGVVNRFLGHWDGNPATLIPLSPADSAPLYVEMMGGPGKIIARAKELHGAGDYMQAQEILNRLVLAQPRNREAKDLLADVWEQIGYQQENPGLRNCFLQGAFELRSGLPAGAPPNPAGPDVIRAMPTGLFLDFLAIRMDGGKTRGMEFTVNLVTPDNGEKFVIELSDQTLTHIEGYQVEDADLTVTIDRKDLETVMMGRKRLVTLIDEGVATASGDRAILDQIASTLALFTPDFEMVPGTRTPAPGPAFDPYEVGPLELRGE
jgi:alkyl sulfatase BDS1-like metallo-beta-lactamase superfamily hydrolase